ncbi:MAG: hypothetical protein ACTH8P_13245 [Ewingella sp.]|uniref:hypothetical protein n=1 Tax=Ewingella TaxID=41201 RepID=UPI00336598C7
MKELSVIEMNAVSGAGWGFWAGAGVGALAGIVATYSLMILNKETFHDVTPEKNELNQHLIAASTLLGALSGAIAEAR